MFKKKSIYVVTLLLGICLICVSLFLRSEEFKKISGICIGVGTSLLGMRIANLYMKKIEQRNPELKKRNEIELKDERNTIIRN